MDVVRVLSQCLVPAVGPQSAETNNMEISHNVPHKKKKFVLKNHRSLPTKVMVM